MTGLKAAPRPHGSGHNRQSMRVRIVCYEDVNQWILGKFARRLCEQLEQHQIGVDIGNAPDPAADINHHIIYFGYDGTKRGVDTLMVTHVDEPFKVSMIKRQLVTAEMAICMSSDTMRKLTKLAVPRSKLCFVNPAHDEIIKPRKLVVGVTSKVQPTGCKREAILQQLAGRIPGADFKFHIMGSGWDKIVASMREKGIEVDYRDHFDPEAYRTLIPSLDYYLYFGQDEGSMGFLDALAAGIQTIVTPQGFHLDAKGGIVHAFNELDELVAIFESILQKRKALTAAVESWTWSKYASDHLLIWQHLLQRKQSRGFPHRLRPELASLGVARVPAIAALQTFAYRAYRKACRVCGYNSAL
jgi:hypothetical protein